MFLLPLLPRRANPHGHLISLPVEDNSPGEGVQYDQASSAGLGTFGQTTATDLAPVETRTLVGDLQANQLSSDSQDEAHPAASITTIAMGDGIVEALAGGNLYWKPHLLQVTLLQETPNLLTYRLDGRQAGWNADPQLVPPGTNRILALGPLRTCRLLRHR
jgi:hypothetical protein